MKRQVIAGITLIVCALSLVLLAAGYAGRNWQQHAWGRKQAWMGQRLMAMLENDRVKTELSLTDYQTDRLRKIMMETQKSSLKTGADMAVRRIELRELLRADKPDCEAVMKKVQQISDLRREMMQQGVEALLAAKNLLTPEQQKKLRTFIESQSGAGCWGESFPEARPGALTGPGIPPEPPRNPDEP